MEFHDKLIDEVPLAVLDTETTGLNPALGHRIIEIAIVRFEGWQETGQINQLVDPGRPISASASRVNGIYDSDVRGLPRFVDLAGEINELLEGALVVAHNAPFDAGFIAAEWSLTGLPPLTNPCACTLQLARQLYSLNRNNLQSVAHAMGVRIGQTHRAMGDVWMTAQIFRRMMRDMNEWNIHTVGQLVQTQGGAIFFPAPPVFKLHPRLDRAIQDHTAIGILYIDNNGYETRRIVEPYYIGSLHGDGYLTAYCRLRNAQRTFRLDRIVDAFPAF
jgi:DNA polymerase III subunit epsilon